VLVRREAKMANGEDGLHHEPCQATRDR
jgi:hypothetical protein